MLCFFLTMILAFKYNLLIEQSSAHLAKKDTFASLPFALFFLLTMILAIKFNLLHLLTLLYPWSTKKDFLELFEANSATNVYFKELPFRDLDNIQRWFFGCSFPTLGLIAKWNSFHTIYIFIPKTLLKNFKILASLF